MRSFLVMAMFTASLTSSALRQNCELADNDVEADAAARTEVSAPLLLLRPAVDEQSLTLTCANVETDETGEPAE